MIFDEKFESFLEGVRKIAHGEISVVNRTRYICLERKAFGQTSVFLFVDRTSGDVLKAASWKAPAKGARGNIFNDDNGLNCIGEYGVKYLR